MCFIDSPLAVCVAPILQQTAGTLNHTFDLRYSASENSTLELLCPRVKWKSGRYTVKPNGKRATSNELFALTGKSLNPFCSGHNIFFIAIGKRKPQHTSSTTTTNLIWNSFIVGRRYFKPLREREKSRKPLGSFSFLLCFSPDKHNDYSKPWCQLFVIKERHTIKILMRADIHVVQSNAKQGFRHSHHREWIAERLRKNDDLIEIIHRCLCCAKDIERKTTDTQSSYKRAWRSDSEVEGKMEFPFLSLL